MIAALILWWQTRSRREQHLILVMLALLGGVVFWLGLWRPVQAWQGAQGQALSHAIAAQRHATHAATALSALEAHKPPPFELPLNDYLKASANEAGFTLTGAEAQGESVRITLTSARPPALIAWLLVLETKGIFINEGRITANSDTTVALDAILRRRAD
jgi:general secretion pathway protein M